jgi:hypothetical protein
MKVGYNSNKEKYLIWHIEGGLGKNIASTALLSSIKEKYPDRKIIMTVSYPDVFMNNPDIYRVYSLGSIPYFYQDYIENKDVLVFRQEGYFQNGHITKQKHLINNWCDILGVQYKNQLPVIKFNLVQKRMVNLWKREKPILLIQSNGGPMNDSKIYSWTRDIPPFIVRQIVEMYRNDYHIVQVCRNKDEVVNGVHEAYYQPISNFELFTLLGASSKRILIDSCLQHAAAALNLPSTVLWIGTSPKVFGYELHSNIIADEPKNKPKLMNSYLFDYSFNGEIMECPYDDVSEIFSLENIFESIDKI